MIKATCPNAVEGATPEDPYRRQRATEDMGDDTPGTYQLYLLYVEPSDRTAMKDLDTSGALRRSVAAANAWLAANANGAKLRWDTCGGVVDVTFVKLRPEATETAMATGVGLSPPGPAMLRERLEAELHERFHDPRKHYIVFYEGRAFGPCASGAFPPARRGHVTAFSSAVCSEPPRSREMPRRGRRKLRSRRRNEVGLSVAPFDATLTGEPVRVAQLSGGAAVFAAPPREGHKKGEVLQAPAHPPDCRAHPSVDFATSVFLDPSPPQGKRRPAW